MTRSAKSTKNLDEILDRWFSRFIRLRNCDKYGYIICITCGRRKHWMEAHSGHYVKRGHSATKFNEQNCAEQCEYCNTQRNGEEQAHRLYIDKTYGEGTADFLKHKGKFPFQMTDEEYLEKIEYYKIKVKKLAKQKGIKL